MRGRFPAAARRRDRLACDEAAEAKKILVAPDVLVSRDGDFPHVELVLAANPKNAKSLVGGAITYTRPDGGTACRTYATENAGSRADPGNLVWLGRNGGRVEVTGAARDHWPRDA